MYELKKCDYSLKFVLSEKKSLCSTLIRNTENSIYFLEQINLKEVLEPYVIDLTEPISIPFFVAMKLTSGINERNMDEQTNQYVTTEEKGITYISILNSPYIEHLLQKFSSFYSRIGTEDISKDASEILKEKLNAM